MIDRIDKFYTLLYVRPDRYYKEEFSVNLYYEILLHHPDYRYIIARNIYTPIEVLDVLSYDHDYNVRMGVASHAKSTHQIHCRLQNDDDEDVRRSLADSKSNLHTEVQERLHEYGDGRTNAKLVARNDISQELFDQLLVSEDPIIRKLAIRYIKPTHKSFTGFITLAAQDESYKMRREAAAHLDTSQSLLEVLNNDENVFVKKVAAFRLYTRFGMGELTSLKSVESNSTEQRSKAGLTVYHNEYTIAQKIELLGAENREITDRNAKRYSDLKSRRPWNYSSNFSNDPFCFHVKEIVKAAQERFEALKQFEKEGAGWRIFCFNSKERGEYDSWIFPEDGRWIKENDVDYSIDYYR